LAKPFTHTLLWAKALAWPLKWRMAVVQTCHLQRNRRQSTQKNRLRELTPLSWADISWHWRF